MIRVLLDARMLLGRFSGVPRFVTRLVDQLAAQDGVRVAALLGNEPYAPWTDRADIDVICTDFRRRDRTPLRRWAWESFRLKHWIERSGADVYHATWNSGIPPRCPIPTVLTIHDLIPWREPVIGVTCRIERAAYRRCVSDSARRASLITTVSDFVRSEVLTTLKVDPARVRTVYNGADVNFTEGYPETNRAANGMKSADWRSSRGVPDRHRVSHAIGSPASQPPSTLPPDEPPTAKTSDRPFVLYVGGFEQRKNLELLFCGVADFQRRFGSLDLCLTGDASRLTSQSRQALDELNDSTSVRFLGHPTDDEVSRLYQSAAALILPSRAEGFGLPAIEAMCSGCPVIAARAGSLPEIVGDAGLLVDPDVPTELAKAIHHVIEDARLRLQLIDRGHKRASQFTWSRTAAQLRGVYESAARGCPQRSDVSSSARREPSGVRSALATTE